MMIKGAFGKPLSNREYCTSCKKWISMQDGECPNCKRKNKKQGEEPYKLSTYVK